MLRRAVLCLAVMLLPGLAFGQAATITGTVTDADGEPLIGANVVIDELVLGSSTDLDGRYSFEVPAANVGQTVTLTARYIGYSPLSREVTVTAGRMTEDFTLSFDALNLDEVVVTGVTEATPLKKKAFTVSKVSGEALELVPGRSAVESMQGKVAGATVLQNTGEPGAGFSVQLRGASSITASSQPLYIVDGVILTGNQVDLGSLDVESIEVVKGAAAASLYGSRAQAGVVQITTKRGTQVPFNTTRVTVRNEFGIQEIPDPLAANSSHDLLQDAQGNFLNADGVLNECASCLPSGYGPGTLQDRELGGVAFYDNPYMGQTFDAFDEFFKTGSTLSNYVAVSQNSARTNFHLSFTNESQTGIIRATDGIDRLDFLLNLDHRLRDNITLAASARYSQSESDQAGDGANFDPFFGLMFTSPAVNIAERDENGELKVQADPLAVEENPLYVVNNQNVTRSRSRILGNLRARYTPLDWLALEGLFSYDRLDRDGLDFYDRGFQTIDPSSTNDGRIERRNAIFEAINADLTASLNRSFGDLTARTQLRYQIENTDSYTEAIFGNSLSTEGISDLDNILGEPDGTRTLDSSESTIRAEAFYALVGFDYDDKYIGDFLIRRDGSSLFGADERWQTYFRVSGAYRMAEEAWWPLENVDEFKLRYSIGTAGQRPDFQAQYETFTIDNGVISKGTLGNAQLRPELTTEQEFGLEIGLFERFFLEGAYAVSTVEDLLLQPPLAGYFGFSSQWQNAGTLESNTFEATLSANALRTRDMSLDFNVTFDRTRQDITEFNVNAFRGGPRSAFFFRDDESLGAMYGARWMSSTSDLPAGANPDAFDVNDDGYLVPVGVGNSFRDGFSGNCLEGGGCWGSSVDTDGDGVGDAEWGIPLRFTEEDGNQFVNIGSVLPDYNLGFGTTFRMKGFTAYMLWNSQVGGDIYNFTKQWSFRDGRAAEQDQSGKAEELKKPSNYYETLYSATDINSHFVEDGTYLRLRELSLGYTFNRSQLQGVFGDVVNQVTLRLTGRNLLTFTDYSGADPEVGSSATGGGAEGNAALYRVDNFDYPRFRTFTGVLEIQF
ncbi:MAG: SusC/RagA family TonB-linked outer membrane protein [Bacteroidota bacterium]